MYYYIGHVTLRLLNGNMTGKRKKEKKGWKKADGYFSEFTNSLSSLDRRTRKKVIK